MTVEEHSRARQKWGDDVVIVGERVALREKRVDDAENDYAWRRDPELAKFDAVPALQTSYHDYLSGYEEGLLYPSPRRRRLAIVTDEGRHIGNCTFYDIDEFRRQAEIGITIGERTQWSQGYGSEAVALLVYYIFTKTSIERLYLHTLDWNIRAQRCFAKAGFIEIDRTKQNEHRFAVMELKRDAWIAVNPGADRT